MKSLYALLIGFTVVASGCRQGESSNVAALDDFLDGSKSSYQCQGGYSDGGETVKIIADNSELVEAVKTTLTAIPDNIKTYFTQIGGHIEVVDNVNEVCSKNQTEEDLALAGRGEAEILGCWAPSESVSAKDEGKVAGGLVIYLQADAAAISQTTVRIFGYVFSQVIQKTYYNEEGANQSSQKVLTDDSGYRYVANELVIDLLAIDGLNESIQEYAQDNPSQFADSVFAEAFDSWYCSEASRKQMQTKFSPLYAHFLAEAAPVISQYDTLEHLDQGVQSVDSDQNIEGNNGLMLAGALSLRQLLQAQQLLLLTQGEYRQDATDSGAKGKCGGFFAKLKAFFKKFKQNKGQSLVNKIAGRLSTEGRCGIFCKVNGTEDSLVSTQNAGEIPVCQSSNHSSKIAIENGSACKVPE